LLSNGADSERNLKEGSSMTATSKAFSVVNRLPDPCENMLLASLLNSDYESLKPHLEAVRLSAGAVLYGAHSRTSYCYFLGDALVSILSTTEHGLSVAAGLVGGEGVTGVVAAILDPRLLPHRTVVQVAGNATRIPSEALRLWCVRNSGLRRPFLRYAHAMFVQLVQTSACNRFHDTKERLARVLLLVEDRMKGRTLPLTQESLAGLLGTDRVSVTRAARDMRRASLISYSRGKLSILDRQGLESAACECYSIIGSAYNDMFCPQ
jgi:CRP-like cAMP-binding protein